MKEQPKFITRNGVEYALSADGTKYLKIQSYPPLSEEEVKTISEYFWKLKTKPWTDAVLKQSRELHDEAFGKLFDQNGEVNLEMAERVDKLAKKIRLWEALTEKRYANPTA